MAGHNKWSQIKRKKAANDKQRGKAISKHVRAIQSAVREGGGGDPAINVMLRNAIGAAKADDVTGDNIERAVERAVGSGEGATAFDAVAYEGYGPSGVAFLVEALTDNRNRTVAEVRHVFTKHGGNMSGSTAWQFDPVGVLVYPVSDEGQQEALQDAAIEAGASDLEVVDDAVTVYTAPSELYAVAEALEAHAGVAPSVAQLDKVPQTLAPVDGADAAKVVRMLEALDDLDDVQNVYTTADLGAVVEVG
ncbi:MAG: YebC/PmpR family DNA-binding transcriptional regulator [Trueperaceae bacterium]